MRSWQIVASGLFALMAGCSDGESAADPPSLVHALAANQNPRILPPTSRAHGASYAEWSARWWQWALGQPVFTSPLVDTTGAACAVDQVEKVWFLAETFGSGSVTRTCTVPAGTPLFIPVANAFCSAEGTAEEMRACAAGFMNSATDIRAEIDGVPIQDLARYRVKSPIFTLDLPPDNIFGAPAGEYAPTAADGIHLLIAPLPPGEHEIHVHALFLPSSIIDATYHLTVAHGGR